jgi:hypothetical protein
MIDILFVLIIIMVKSQKVKTLLRTSVYYNRNFQNERVTSFIKILSDCLIYKKLSFFSKLYK